MQQKVSICCALLHRPKVAIFDEPLVGLDPHAIKELKDIFVELKQAGASVLISTHMLDSVEDYWDVAHIMMNGSFAATKFNRPGQEGEKTLEELFFDITEGKGARTMKGLRYLFFTTVKNSIKELVKHPAKLVMVLFFVLLIGMMVVSSLAAPLPCQ